MYVCIKLFIEFNEPYNIIPNTDVFQEYFVAEERLRPYLEDGFEVVCIEPRLFGITDEQESTDKPSDIACFAGEDGIEIDYVEMDFDIMEKDAAWPDAYYDTGRFVYMVKELDDVSTFDRDKYKPDDYTCMLMYERADWVYEQYYCFRPENDPFKVWGSLPFKEFPSWPDTSTEQTEEEKAAEMERIQMLYNAVRSGEIELEDLDIIDLLRINGMMRRELAEKEKHLQREKEMFENLMRLHDEGVPIEELQRILREYNANCSD